MIPLVDLGWQYAEIRDEVEPAVLDLMARSQFIGGEPVRAFEEELAAFSGAAHCIGVANGTDALEIALRAVGVVAGDEVVLPANTFIATAEAVVRMGARPVLVDCDEHHLIDADQAVERMRGARAILPVHLYGQMAPLELLIGEAERVGCAVIADAAQAQGATRNGAGIAHGVAAAGTSFYPGKNLGAFGDAGAVLTDDAAVARRVRLYGEHGSDTKYVHEVMGCTSRLDPIQAIPLRAKLHRLAAWNELRRAAAARYDELLAPLGVGLPRTLDGNEHVWHLYVIRVPERDRVLAALHDAGVGAGIHYPTPVHLHDAWKAAGGGDESHPAAEAACREILSLPMWPGITPAMQEHVADALSRAL